MPDLYYTDSGGNEWMERYQVSTIRGLLNLKYVVVDLDNNCKIVSKEYIRYANANKRALSMNLEQRAREKK